MGVKTAKPSDAKRREPSAASGRPEDDLARSSKKQEHFKKFVDKKKSEKSDEKKVEKNEAESKSSFRGPRAAGLAAEP